MRAFSEISIPLDFGSAMELCAALIRPDRAWSTFDSNFFRRASRAEQHTYPDALGNRNVYQKFQIFSERRATVSVGPSAHRDSVAELKGSSGCGGVFRRRATAGSISGILFLELSVHVLDFGQTQAKSPEFQRTLFFSLGKRDGCPSRYLCHFFGWL
jgi:hypothetical protein